MRHRVFLNDSGFIENVYVGDLKYEELQKMFKQTYELGFGLQDLKKPVRLIVDLSAIGDVPLKEIAPLATLGLKSFPFNKISIYGARKEIMMMANLILGMAGKRKILHVSKTREEALEWLKEEPA